MTNNEARDAAIDRAFAEYFQGDDADFKLTVCSVWNAATAHTRGEVIDEFVRRVMETSIGIGDRREVSLKKLQALAAEMKEK